MQRDRLEARLPPLAITALAAAAMLAIEFFLPTPGLTRFGITAVVGAAFAAAGITVALAGVIAFRAARTTVDPLHPERSDALVTTGVYRVSRNPMYLGFVAALLGLAIVLSSPIGALLAFAIAMYLDRLQIRPEERVLLLRFGSDYEQYTRSVHRWL